MGNNIISIAERDVPPKVVKCKFCAKCGYNEYCYS